MLAIYDDFTYFFVILLPEWRLLIRQLFPLFVQLTGFFFLLSFVKIYALLDALGNQFGLFFGLSGTLNTLSDF